MTTTKFRNRAPVIFDVSPEQRADALRRHQVSEKLLDEKQRKKVTGISRSTWYRLTMQNRAPKPRKIDNKNRYLLSDLILFFELS